jgi:hypothetical protein
MIDPYSIDQQQFAKVKEIKEKYKNEGIIWEFSDIYEFKESQKYLMCSLHLGWR